MLTCAVVNGPLGRLNEAQGSHCVAWRRDDYSARCHTRAAATAGDPRGYLSSKDERSEAGITAAIKQGLNENGFVEGKSVSFIYRWSAGDYRHLPELAAELVKEKVDVIAASGLLPILMSAFGGKADITRTSCDVRL
jgi:hypothetical protein